MSLDNTVSIYEVALRDGLQNEATFVSTSDKVRLFDALQGAGLKRIELTSFVNPKWIPALADAEALCAAVKPQPGVLCTGLIPNARGFARALGSGLGEIALALSASETHNQKNINRSVEETLAEYMELVPQIRAQGFRVRAYISTVWGCPYEGRIPPAKVLAIAERLLAMGCDQLSLGDTIGVATPLQTRDVLRAFSAHIGLKNIAMHMHDTRGTALANVLAGLEEGVREVDASLGGLGGCPYAPGAAGNLCTEDLAYMLEGMGMRTGVNVSALAEAARFASTLVGRALPGKVHQAGVWPQ